MNTLWALISMPEFRGGFGAPFAVMEMGQRDYAQTLLSKGGLGFTEWVELSRDEYRGRGRVESTKLYLKKVHDMESNACMSRTLRPLSGCFLNLKTSRLATEKCSQHLAAPSAPMHNVYGRWLSSEPFPNTVCPPSTQNPLPRLLSSISRLLRTTTIMAKRTTLIAKHIRSPPMNRPCRPIQHPQQNQLPQVPKLPRHPYTIPLPNTFQIHRIIITPKRNPLQPPQLPLPNTPRPHNPVPAHPRRDPLAVSKKHNVVHGIDVDGLLGLHGRPEPAPVDPPRDIARLVAGVQHGWGQGGGAGAEAVDAVEGLELHDPLGGAGEVPDLEAELWREEREEGETLCLGC